MDNQQSQSRAFTEKSPDRGDGSVACHPPRSPHVQQLSPPTESIRARALSRDEEKSISPLGGGYNSSPTASNPPGALLQPHLVDNLKSDPTPGLSKPPSVHRTDRNVSWGEVLPPMLNVSTMNDAADDLSRITSPLSPGRNLQSLTIHNVMEHSPFESEAEAMIHRALEGIDPSSPTDLNQSTLFGLTIDDESEIIFDQSAEADADSKVSASTQASRTKKVSALKAGQNHGKKKTAAEVMFGFTEDMSRLNKPHRGLRVSKGSELMEDTMPNAGGALAANAARLMKRNKLHDISSESEPIEPTLETKATSLEFARSRMSCIIDSPKPRNRRRKNSDELEDTPRETFDDCDESGAEAASPKTSTRLYLDTRKRAERVAKYKEFEDWFRKKKTGLVLYAKIVVFGIMIPATSLAALLFYELGK
jgi:hypothetical protein